MRRRDDRHKHSMPVKPSDAGRERRPINQVKPRAGQGRVLSEGEMVQRGCGELGKRKRKAIRAERRGHAL